MHIDEANTWGAAPPPWFKGHQDTRREPASVPIALWHQTAVAGGFGVSAQALERHDGDAWAALLERFTGSASLADKSDDGKAGEPYHYIYRPQERVVVAVWHPELYSYHGNYNSATIGVAIDGSYPGDELDGTALKFAFAAVLEHLSGVGFDPPTLEYHRQHSAGRGGDPGQEVAIEVETLAIAFGLHADPLHTTGSGQTVPDSWRSPLAGGSAPSTCDHPTLDINAMPSGTRDDDVVALQALLHARGKGPAGLIGGDGRPDGKPGSGTDRELREYQSEHGLAADGVAGPATWSSLYDA